MIEGKLVPLAVFLAFLEFVGESGAVLAALAWTLGCIGFRIKRGQRVPGLVVLAAIGLTARSVIAIVSGSMFAYLLQPTVSTAFVAVALAVSVVVGQPLAARLAHDLCPFDEHTSNHPHVRSFFTRLTVLWAVTSSVNAAITLWLLLTQSTATFVLVKSFLGPVTTFVTLTIGITWFRFTARAQGLRWQFVRVTR